MKKNNKGFSLVELIVAFAIAAIAGLAVYGMMSVGGNIFRSSSREVGLQYEQQIVVNQIRDFILESSDSISYDESTKSLYVFSQGITTVTESGVAVEKDSYDITELTLVKPLDEAGNPAVTGEIQYRTVGVTNIADDYKTELNGKGRVTLGENVKDITYDLSEVEKGKVTFTITFFDQDKEISSTQTVSLRNKIKNLDELGEIYDTTREEINSFIDGILILRDEVEMGSTDTVGRYVSNFSIQYDAKVVTNQYSTRAYSVTWSITLPEGKDADAATINASTGLVTINSSKWSNAESFTIRATSVDDKSKFKDLTIVIDGEAVFPTEAKLECNTNIAGASDGSEGINVTNVKVGNGWAEYTLIPTIKYSDEVENKGTNILTGDEALDRIGEWVIEGDKLPGTKYDIVSGVDRQTGKLRLSAEANGKTYTIYFKVKQKDVNGEVVKSNPITINPTNIPEYNTEEVLLISAAGSMRRGTSYNVMASWKSSPGFRVQYFWKIVPYQDNTSAAWTPLSDKNWRNNFDATISVPTQTSSVYAQKYNGDIGQFGSFGTYISNANDDTEDEDGSKNTDDDVLTDITSDNWYTGIDPGRIFNINIKSYLDWNNDYKAKVLLFAYDKENNLIYDQKGGHAYSRDSLIVPVEAVITIPKVEYSLAPTNYVNNEYRYSENKEEYKEFLTEYILRPNDKWPGERRVFFGSTIGLYIESSHSQLKNGNEGRDIQNHYTYYRDRDKVAVKNRTVVLKYMENASATEGNVDTENYWGERNQLGWMIDVKKGGQYNRTDFFTYYPNRMEFYSTLYQVNNVTFNGVTQTIYNYAHSQTFNYEINYDKRND